VREGGGAEGGEGLLEGRREKGECASCVQVFEEVKLFSGGCAGDALHSEVWLRLEMLGILVLG